MFSKKQLISILLAFVCLPFVACGPSTSVRIQDKFEPLRKPNFNYDVKNEKKKPSGYTIGIIQPNFIIKNQSVKDQEGWHYDTPQEKQYLEDFKKEIAYGLEKVLISKGNRVSGPFAAYEDMTYPERDRCSFLIQPTFSLETSVQRPIFNPLEASGPNGEWAMYYSGNTTIIGRAEMEYVILEPLTKDKLERHKLKTKEISVQFEEYAQKVYNPKTKEMSAYVLSEVAEKYHPQFRSAYSTNYGPLNASGKILEELLQGFLLEANKLISVEEFKYLEKYKSELRSRKRY